MKRTFLHRVVARLRGDTRGNVAMIAGLSFMGAIAIGGTAIDLHRAYSARAAAQDAIDLAGLAAASTRHSDAASLERAARDFLNANTDIPELQDDPDIQVQVTDISRLDISLRGSVPSIFMGLIGVNSLPVEVDTAVERGAVDRVELALVLDNTWSMSADDGTGTTKISALKTAAGNLVEALMTREDGSVKVGVVPYADYVNVGLGNRNAAWLYDTADYVQTKTEDIAAVERKCTKHTSKQSCKKSATPKTCIRDTDGIKTSYDCTPNECTTTTVAEYETCTEAKDAYTKVTNTSWKWYGCVGSRREGQSRLNDTPGHLYPGIRTTGAQNCLNPITPLTDRKQTVTTALSSLIVNIGTSYQPFTYIPAGLIWGVNMLSPTAPLTEAADYQADGRDPRKIMVLMTDGANYLRFNSGNGTHTKLDGGQNGVNQLAKTDNDTAAICEYAKSKGIEVYTVALAVDSTSARQMLETCASGEENYYDASNATTLARAFADIAASIYRVRIVE